MEQRQAAEDHILFGDLEHVHAQLAVAEQVVVGQFGAFGLPGGSRGVKHDGGVAGQRIGHFGDCLRSVQQSQETGTIDGHHVDRIAPRVLSSPGRPGKHLGRDAFPGERQGRLGIRQVVSDFPGFQQRIHRNHDAPGPQHPVKNRRHLRQVRADQCHPVASLDALGGEQPGHFLAEPVQRRITELRLVHFDRGPIRERRRRGGQHRGNIHRVEGGYCDVVHQRGSFANQRHLY